jgi:peptidoglycan-associated lipoprotein
MQPGTSGQGQQSPLPTPPAVGAPGTTPTPPPRPAVRDFAAVPELQDIYFDFDKYDIRPADARTLDANAAWLKSNPNHLILIEGHCDERGTNEYNLALGERRADAARDYLVSLGVPADSVTIVSKGEEQPFCSDETETCWQQNRRGHFLVTAK